MKNKLIILGFTSLILAGCNSGSSAAAVSPKDAPKSIGAGYLPNTSQKYKSISSLTYNDPETNLDYEKLVIVGAEGKIYQSMTELDTGSDLENVGSINWAKINYSDQGNNNVENFQQVVTCGPADQEFMVAVGDGGMAYGLQYNDNNQWSVTKLTNDNGLNTKDFTSVACSRSPDINGNYSIVAVANTTDSNIGIIFQAQYKAGTYLDQIKLTTALAEPNEILTSVSYYPGNKSTSTEADYFVGGYMADTGNNEPLLKYTPSVANLYGWADVNVADQMGAIRYIKADNMPNKVSLMADEVLVIGDNETLSLHAQQSGFSSITYFTNTGAVNSISCSTVDCIWSILFQNSPSKAIQEFSISIGGQLGTFGSFSNYANSGSSSMAASDIYYEPNLEYDGLTVDGTYFMLYDNGVFINQVWSNRTGGIYDFSKKVTANIDPSWS